MRDLSRSVEITNIAASQSREDAIAVIQSGCLRPELPETALIPQDEFSYRHNIAYGVVKGFSRLERFMLSMYGRAYLDAPELSEFFYKDIETRAARSAGQIALFANLYTKKGLSAVTIGFLGDTEVYPEHVRLSAQSANFSNTLGLSGLTRVKLETYQRIVLDKDGQLDLPHSVLVNTPRLNPFIVEHIKLHDDLHTRVERKEMIVGAREIKEWAIAHLGWSQYVKKTLGAVRSGTSNPIVDFHIPGHPDVFNNLASLEHVLNFEEDDDL